MIKLIVFLPFLIKSLMAFQYNMVFIHIGQSLPHYIKYSLKQAADFNPDCNIFLLANRNALNNAIVPATIQTVSLESIQKTNHHLKFNQRSKLDKSFRDGFWYSASERFLYLDDFIQQYGLKNIFHLENDCMIYCDLQEFLPIFMNFYPNIGAIFDYDSRCIPSFLYINNAKSSAKLAHFFAKIARTNKNDMEVIALFRKAHPKYIQSLPIIPPTYAHHYSLKNNLNQISEEPEIYYKNFELFNSIFDAAAIGQYLGGIDPRNGLSEKGFINETCIFNPSHALYLWQEDSLGRKIPYMQLNNNLYRINNLHIHSKKLYQFISIESSL